MTTSTVVLLVIDLEDCKLGTGDVETKASEFFDAVTFFHKQKNPDSYFPSFNEFNGFEGAYVTRIPHCDVEEVVKIFHEIDWLVPKYATLFVRHCRNDPGTLHRAKV